jgi:virginiamycin A acetyltransferase
MWLFKKFGLRCAGCTHVYPTAEIWAPWNVEMGRYVAIDDRVNLYSVNKITIGTKVAISREAFICTASHDITKPNRPLVTAPITICDGVWIGARAIVLPGVTIGDGAIIGANSVVGSDVAPYTVVAGNPAKALRKRFDDALIDLLLRFKWWDKSIEEIQSLIPILTCSDLEKVRAELQKRLD